MAITLAGGVLLATSSAYAQDKEEKYATIVQRLVQKFGLKETDVQAVFDENRKEQQLKMQTRLEEQLTQAVKDGKLTEDQKKLILAKHLELQNQKTAKPENWQNLTPQQRLEAMQKQKRELKSWAEQNNIDLKYLFGFGLKGRGCSK